MFARLTALVGSGSSLPFEVIGEPSLIWGSWTHSSGKWKADGSAVSVFRVSSSNPSDPKLAAARNGTKRLRTVSQRMHRALKISAMRRTRHCWVRSE